MLLLLHPSDQPVFRLRGSAAQCRLELRLNDVPLHQEEAGRAHHFDFAVNEWLFQGGNRIEVRLSPPGVAAEFPAGAFLEMAVLHKPAHEGQHSVREVGKMSWRPEPSAKTPGTHSPQMPDTETLLGAAQPAPPVDDEPSLLALPGQAEELSWAVEPAVHLPEGMVSISSQLPLPPPWSACPWQRGPVLMAHDDNRQTVHVCLRTLHAALRADAWRPLLEVRRAAIQAAYHLPEHEVDEALGFPPLLRQPGWQLEPLPAEMPQLEIAGKGRLARMIDPATGMSPLVFKNQAQGILAEVQAWWMFSGKWLLVR